MNAQRLLALAVFVGSPADAHRLDEYLQATLVSIETSRVEAQMRLTPGVAVWPRIRARVDTDADGAIEAQEQQAYAQRVLRDLTLTVDGHALSLELLSVTLLDAARLEDGLGEILIEFSAALPSGSSHRTLVFENRHESEIAAYLANCLVPRDGRIRIVSQRRNERQSVYAVDYAQR